MNELEIVKALFKAYSNHEAISVKETSGSIHTGEISFFDGNLIQIENKKIELAAIDNIEEPSTCIDSLQKNSLPSGDYQQYVGYKSSYKEFTIDTKQGTELLNGFVFDVSETQMVVLTDREKKIIDLNKILDIKDVTSVNQEKPAESSVETGFEKALLAADIEQVKQYCASPDMLSEEGYSIDEVNFIIKSANTPIPWNDTEENREYNQARRLYTIVKNRGNLAGRLFEQVVIKKTAPKKRIAQALQALIEINKESLNKLNALFNDNKTLILSNTLLRQNMVDAFVAAGDFSKARSLVDESSIAPESIYILMSLEYYENCPHDVRTFLNIDAFDNEIGFKELRSIALLPEKTSVVQLLCYFNKKDRNEDFFSLLSLVMPYARNDAQIVDIVKKCLSKDSNSQYITDWLPKFPLLWFDKQLCEKFFASGSSSEETDTVVHLFEQCKRAAFYSDTNELEEAIINGNYELFDVLRNNSSILLAMGYTSNEISTIKIIEKEYLQFECKTVLERLISLEGNRGYVAESLAGSDFLRNPKKVCTILFPILIQQNYAGLVYELYNYSPYIKLQLSSLRDYYLQALLLLGKKDEYWDAIKDNWLELNMNADLVQAGYEIAKMKGDYLTANAMEIMVNGGTLNEIEKALVSGNIPRLRSCVMDMPLLFENDYSETDISLLQENLKRKIDFSSHDSLSIANRLYSFQKNKNRVAELYYTLALKDSTNLAAMGLFSIYADENRFRELVDVFEGYISDFPELCNIDNIATYLNALYQTHQYQKYFDYWMLNHDAIKADVITALDVFVNIGATDSTIVEITQKYKVEASKDKIEQIKSIIRLLASGYPSDVVLKTASLLYNSAFVFLTSEDVDDIKQSLIGISVSECERPFGDGIRALFEGVSENLNLYAWYELLISMNGFDDDNFGILMNISKIYDSGLKETAECIGTIVKSQSESGKNIPIELKKYLLPRFASVDEETAWIDRKIETVNTVDESTYELVCDLARSHCYTERIHKYFIALSNSRTSFEDRIIKDSIDLLASYLIAGESESRVAELIDSINRLGEKNRISDTYLVTLLEGCLYASYYEEAFLIKTILNEKPINAQFPTECTDCTVNRPSTYDVLEGMSFYSVVNSVLCSGKLQAIDELCSQWGKYFKILESDTAGLGIIKDYYDNPNKWPTESINFLAKHLLCMPKTLLYWQLLSIHYAEGNTSAKACILFHKTILEGKYIKPAIDFLIANELQNQTIEAVGFMLSKEYAHFFNNSIATIEEIIEKKPEWLRDKSIASHFLKTLYKNSAVHGILQMWNAALDLAMKLAFTSGAEEEFYELFGSDLKNDYPDVNGRFLCMLLLEKQEQSELILSSYGNLRIAVQNTPYRKLLFGVLSSMGSGILSDVQKDLLRILSNSRNNAIIETDLYKYYMDSVAMGTSDRAKTVLEEIRKYIPNLPVYEDINKYEVISKNPEDEQIAQIYNAEFNGLRALVKPERIQKAILNLIPGELYLKARGFEVISSIEYGLKTLKGASIQEVHSIQAAFMSLDNIFEANSYPDLAIIFMKCSFIRKWNDLICYRLDDTDINEILKSDATIKHLVFKRSYEILKSAINSILDATDEEVHDVISRVDSFFIATEGIRRSKNYLRRIQKMDESDKTVLRRVFSLRIESKTLRKSGIIGSTILSIPGNEKVAYLIGMLDQRNLSEIFDNNECLRVLSRMDEGIAQEVASIYSTFFCKESNNVFTRYIKWRQTDYYCEEVFQSPFDTVQDICKPQRIRYLNAKKKLDSTTVPITKALKKEFETNKADYLLVSVINNAESDIAQITPSFVDYLSVVTQVFNRHTMSKLREYLWKLDTEYLMPCLAVVMTLLEQYPMAYEAASKIVLSIWKENVLQIILRAMIYSKLPPEDYAIKKCIQAEIPVSYEYFIGKFVPLNKAQNPVYIEKMKALYEFTSEFVKYMAFRGIDVSWFSLNENRFNESIQRYSAAREKESDLVSSEPEIKNQNKENITSIISEKYLRDAINSSVDVAPAPIALKRGIPQLADCISLLKYIQDSKADSFDERDLLQVRNAARWIYLLSIDINGYSRELFNHTLELIDERDSIAKAQWDFILSDLYQYFEKISSVQQLSRIVESDISNLRNVGRISNSQIRIMRNEDVSSWNTILAVITNASGIDFTRTSESEQILRLIACRTNLLGLIEGKKSTFFDQINNHLLTLINEQISALRHNPELSITVIGENDNNSQTLLWEDGNNRGSLYAIISNIGGADCRKVSISSYINMGRTRRGSINTVYVGEKIPFTEHFSESDLIDGKVTWDIELSYYDNENGKMTVGAHKSIAFVKMGGESLSLGNINTGNPAKGKNFVGRTRELTLLRNHYSDDDQIPSMLIRGLKRSGKSSILIQFSEEMKKKGTFIVSIVDGQSIGGNIKNAFIDKVLESIRINYRGEKEYTDLFNNRFPEFKQHWLETMSTSDWIGKLDVFYYELSVLFGKKILILVDEMEAIFYNNRFETVPQEDSLYAALRSLIQKPENYVSFIFCGSDTLITSCLEQRRESQMFQTLQYLEVGHMNIGDICEIFRRQSERFDIVFSPDSVETIWQFTNGLVWYAKLLGNLVINNIMANDLTVRREVNRADITEAVQMLINGEIGTDKYDLVDASLNTSRSAIIYAMASIMPDYNKEVSASEIAMALKMMVLEGYTNPKTGEKLSEMNENTIRDHLRFLEKMQFVDSNVAQTKYTFAAELYRLFFRKEKKLHMFEEGAI